MSRISGVNKSSSGTRLSGMTATRQVPAPSAITGTDRLELSDQARLLGILEDEVEQLPVIDMAKVESLREAIQSGKMPIDRELLAKKIQQFESFLQDIDS
ncbi:MAG: flagellar biosynthesis anti-sigma factor FlgM [Oceanospirillales bacterium LUC14_002_19_P2]|nr:MAG: flagellar biosynthesis anti-sigma factor FlgM [Oceanospirillales bacterium LUC14_002_19_P2]